ncbi:MAG: DUF2013 domain-containing protein [archaeon]|nr:DUF2013 domain-containing protein [archaeon]
MADLQATFAKYRENYDNMRSDYFKEWLKEVTDPSKGLMDTIIKAIQDDGSSFDLKKECYDFIAMCYFYELDCVKKIGEAEKMPETLSKYVSNLTKDNFDVKGAEVYILNWNLEKYQPFYTQSLMDNLFISIGSIDNAVILEHLGKLFTATNNIYTSPESNLFLKAYHNSNNKRIFDEMLLRLLNEEKENEKIMVLYNCLLNLIETEKRCIFYKDDLATLMDILINRLVSSYHEEVKMFALTVLKMIVVYPEYYDEMYKMHELEDLLGDYKTNDETSDTVKALAEKILDIFKRNLIKKMKKEPIDPKDFEEEEEYEEGEYEEEEGGE